LTASAFNRSQSLADQAADRIRLRIVRGELELGEALSETSLAAQLGVSKTPVREALLRLRSEGLVDIQPQRGTFVFQISGTEAHVLSEFRDVLETAALRCAMRRDVRSLVSELKRILADMEVAVAEGDAGRYRERDDAFHRSIVDHSRNGYLCSAYETIAIRVQALRNRLSREVDLNYLSFKEHKALVRLIEMKQTAKAVALLRKHIARTPDDYAMRLTAVGQI
jgi:DNA-binding GntR family transcriptional regulator